MEDSETDLETLKARVAWREIAYKTAQKEAKAAGDDLIRSRNIYLNAVARSWKAGETKLHLVKREWLSGAEPGHDYLFVGVQHGRVELKYLTSAGLPHKSRRSFFVDADNIVEIVNG